MGIRLLIIQENSWHAHNWEFRECFSLQRVFSEYNLTNRGYNIAKFVPTGKV